MGFVLHSSKKMWTVLLFFLCLAKVVSIKNNAGQHDDAAATLRDGYLSQRDGPSIGDYSKVKYIIYPTTKISSGGAPRIITGNDDYTAGRPEKYQMTKRTNQNVKDAQHGSRHNQISINCEAAVICSQANNINSRRGGNYMERLFKHLPECILNGNHRARRLGVLREGYHGTKKTTAPYNEVELGYNINDFVERGYKGGAKTYNVHLSRKLAMQSPQVYTDAAVKPSHSPPAGIDSVNTDAAVKPSHSPPASVDSVSAPDGAVKSSASATTTG